MHSHKKKYLPLAPILSYLESKSFRDACGLDFVPNDGMEFLTKMSLCNIGYADLSLR